MSRYCPVCDDGMEALVCPIHKVPTVSEKSFNHGPVPIAVGDLVDGEYTVTAVLGEGSMGTVFAVSDAQGRQLALKAIKVRDDSSRQLTKRFYREALVVSKLQHPGVVQIERFAVDERSGLPYLTMEFIQGQTLYDYLASTDASVATVIDVISQLLDTLAHAHELGIVHRDLKPENVMVIRGQSGGDIVKVLDFGIAKILEHDGDAPTLTATGVAVGTPYYMSPEQAKGSKVTPAADLYSVACLLFEMLTDAPPFEGSDFMSILINHVRAPVPLMPTESQKGEVIPEHIRQVIYESLSKDAKERPRSALEMRLRLQGEGSDTLKDTVEMDGLALQSLATSEAHSGTPDTVQPEEAPRLHGKHLIWLLVVIVAVILSVLQMV